MNQPTTLLVIESQPLFLEGLACALKNAWPQLTLHVSSSLDEARHLLNDVRADCVVASREVIQEEYVPELVSKAAPAPVLLTSHHVGEDVVASALRAGVRGYLPKTMTGEAIRSAVVVVLSGGVCFPHRILPQVATVPVAAQRNRAKRELEVLAYLGEGLSNKAIARELGLSIATVKLHVQSLLRSTGARSRLEAVIKARRMGILPPSA